MSVKIRLQRHGRKKRAFFHIVVADSRARRDGRFIEKIGTYNPVTNPATIELDLDKSVDWLMKGAQPTNTVRAILSYKGAMLKKHLLGGVAKGAFDEAEAEKRFQAWLDEKESSINKKMDSLSQEEEAKKKARLSAEQEVAKARVAVEEVTEEAEATEEVAAEGEEAQAEESVEETAEVEAEAKEEVAEEAAPTEEEGEEKA